MVTEGKKQILSHMLERPFSHEKIGGWQNRTLLGKLLGFANNGPPSLPNPSSPIPSSPNPTSIVNRDRGW